MTKVTRRAFIKSSAMAAATAAAATQFGEAEARTRGRAAAPAPGSDGVKWDKAPCRFCGTGCHVEVGVRGGKVVGVRGAAKAAVNKGLLCVKGYHVGGILYGKDRLTTPQLRVGGVLKDISWDKALDIMAERVEKGPKGFAFYGSGQWTIPEGYVAQKFMKGGLSCNHIDPNARLCMASAVTAFLGVYGVDEPAGCYADLEAADVVILWGNNPAEMHPILFSRVIDRRSRGERVRVIDLTTRRTRSSGYADDVFIFKPHGDLAIALGIMHQLIKTDTYNKDFVKKHCNFRFNPDPKKPSLWGKPMKFEDFKKALEPYTPAKVEELSGVPADKIVMLGKLFGDRKVKITSLWCMGMNQHTRGTAVNTLVHGVHLLSGHFGVPGDSPTSLTGQPSACGTAREVGTLAHALPGGRVVFVGKHREHCEKFWNLPKGRIHGKPGYHTVKMWEQFTKPTDKGGDVHTIYVQVTNPGQSLPNLNHLFNDKKGMKDKFLIVSEVYPTATTKLADLVLPASMWVEKNGVFGNSERRTQQWFKMVEPPGDARDDTWQTIALAKRLYDRGFAGMKDKDGKFLFEIKGPDGKPFPAWDWKRYYDMNVDKALFEEYRPFTTMQHKDIAPYDVYVKTHGLRWPVVKQKDGTWRETRFRFWEGDDPYVKKGNGFQFYHSKTKDGKAQIWFHPYEPPPEMPDKDYPFWLCTGRVVEHWHTGTMTMRVPQLRRAMPHAYVELNRKDALRLGVHNGDRVVVESRRGSVTLPVWVDGRSQTVPGSVFVPFFDENSLINNVTLHLFCPISKEPDYKKCAVRIRRA